MQSSSILGIFAKQPCAGTAKTRLAQATSAEWARRVAEAFLEDTLDRFANVPVCRNVVYSPSDAAGYFSRLVNGRYELQPQSGGDLGQRLQAFVDDARRRNFTRMVAIGTDSPTLPVDYVEQAFALLDNKDAVIGPACDGGFYLIGLGLTTMPLFANIPWSTSNVLSKTIERVTMQSLALLPPWYDVDTLDDWQMLCGHVKAMRAAGVDVGAPRVERLVVESA